MIIIDDICYSLLMILLQDIHFVALDAGNVALAENAKNKALEIDSELLSTGKNGFLQFYTTDVLV